jgi:CO/xanthine dehydrogenase Mo-binding subunit
LNYKYVGKEIPRVDSFEKVTGMAKFVADLEVPGMLYGKFLRSPHAHARILSIDTKKAESYAGVVAAITGQAFPYRMGLYVRDKMVLAKDKVRWAGEPVAAVAAESEEAAEEAVELINVEYEPLKPVFDVNEALKPNAPIVHEELSQYEHSPVFTPVPGTNIANIFKVRKGNAEDGFRGATTIIENEFSMPQVSHVAMEPRACIAQYFPDGSAEIWTCAQSPFAVRYILSHALGIPLQKINVHVPHVGGGFGGKAGINFEPLAVLLSKFSGGRPVKLLLTREEEFTTAPLRQGFYGWIKTGVDRSGKIVAEQMKYLYDAGAYADYGVNIGRAAGYACTGPYEVPNIHCDSVTVYTNHPYGTAFRGFGHLEFLWAIERQMDLISQKIGVDPVEFRLRNVLRAGSITATGERLREDAGRVDQCIKAVAESIGWGQKDRSTEPGKFRGIGIAALWKAPAMPPNAGSSAIIKFNEDGSANLAVGVTEIGQGTTTSLAQIAAEELGMRIEKIRVVPERITDLTPYSWQTVASRNLFMEGKAVIEAARDAKEQILNMAAQALRVPKTDLVLEDEMVFPKGQPERGIPLQQFAMGYTYPNGTAIGGPVIGRGSYVPRGLTYLDPETGQGFPALKWTFGAQGVKIEVDVETGEVRTLKVASAFDIGKAINPLLVRGQAYGGMLQSLSIGLMEGYVYNSEGSMLNSNLTDYKIARASDMPEEHVVTLIENPQSDGPYGARGIGELTMLSIPAAIAGAISNAIGVQMFNLPMTPEYVWTAIKKQKPELLAEAR